MLILIFVLVLLFLYGEGEGASNRITVGPGPEAGQLHRLATSAHQILRRLGWTLPRPLRLQPTEDLSRIEQKHIIYLVLYRQDGQRFDDQSLLLVLLHELAHVFAPHDKNHGEEFDRALDQLQMMGRRLGLIEVTQVDHYYPCQRHVPNPNS